MPKQMQKIDWPPQFDRTDPRERSRNNRFEKTLRQSIDDLEAELGRVGVDDWRLSTGAEHQKQNPKYPYADASPDDPGAVVRWSMDGEQYAVACDAYSRLRDNIRTLYLYIREKRKMEDRPVETGESEFANARLPPGDEENDVVVAGSASKQPHDVLDVAFDAPAEVVKAAYRSKVKDAHPDQGGTNAEMKRLQEAKEAMLDGR
jgi:hypothetical protein